jgi:hypothetical protein
VFREPILEAPKQPRQPHKDEMSLLLQNYLVSDKKSKTQFKPSTVTQILSESKKALSKKQVKAKIDALMRAAVIELTQKYAGEKDALCL